MSAYIREMKMKKPHHHGNLRAALIVAGLELLQSGGVPALSIRKLAQKAGVTHAAPAHHFPNLKSLRTALAVEGFKMFTQSMESQLAEVDDDPRTRIIAAGKGYLRFAKDNSGLFNLIFGGTDLDGENAELVEASEAAYQVLQMIAEPIAIRNGASASGNKSNEMMIWSLIHGLAGLMLNDKSGRIDPAHIDQIFDSILPSLTFK